MLDKIKLTVKHTFFYALGNLAPKLSGFILLPIYTKYISVSDYGILGLLEVIEVFIAQLLGLGLSQAQLRWLGLAANEIKKKSYLFTILSFLLLLSVVNILIFFIFRNPFSTLFIGDISAAGYLFILSLIISLSMIIKIPLTLLRSEQKSNWYALVIFIQFSINLAFNIYFLVFRKMGLAGVLYSQAISCCIVLIILSPYLLSRITNKFELDELKTMIKFGFPIALSSISAIVLNLGDRYILTHLSTLEQVGLYSLAYKISNIVKVFVVDAFILTLPTVAWKIIKENDYPQRFFSKTMTYYVLALVWFGLTLGAFHKGLIHKFALNKLYWDATQVVPLLILGIIIYGITGFLYFILQIPMKTSKVAKIIAFVAGLNIMLNLIFIPKFEMLGAAFATILSQLTALALAYKRSQEAYKVNYELGRILVIFCIATAIFGITLIFDGLPVLQRILFKIVLVGSFPLILQLFNFYTDVEVNRMKGSLRKWSKIILHKN